jgi:hypothetical protein
MSSATPRLQSENTAKAETVSASHWVPRASRHARHQSCRWAQVRGEPVRTSGANRDPIVFGAAGVTATRFGRLPVFRFSSCPRAAILLIRNQAMQPSASERLPKAASSVVRSHNFRRVADFSKCFDGVERNIRHGLRENYFATEHTLYHRYMTLCLPPPDGGKQQREGTLFLIIEALSCRAYWMWCLYTSCFRRGIGSSESDSSASCKGSGWC